MTDNNVFPLGIVEDSEALSHDRQKRKFSLFVFNYKAKCQFYLSIYVKIYFRPINVKFFGRNFNQWHAWWYSAYTSKLFPSHFDKILNDLSCWKLISSICLADYIWVCGFIFYVHSWRAYPNILLCMGQRLWLSENIYKGILIYKLMEYGLN